jgi:hypothetical protein
VTSPAFRAVSRYPAHRADTNPSGAPSGTLRALARYRPASIDAASSRPSIPGPPANRTAASTSGTNWRRYAIEASIIARCP